MLETELKELFIKVNKLLLNMENKEDIRGETEQSIRELKESIRALYYESIEETVLRNKGDYMREVKRLDNRVKEIDSAIPLYYSKKLRELNIKADSFCMVYWKSGKEEIVNIIEHYTLLKNNQ